MADDEATRAELNTRAELHWLCGYHPLQMGAMARIAQLLQPTHDRALVQRMEIVALGSVPFPRPAALQATAAPKAAPAPQAMKAMKAKRPAAAAKAMKGTKAMKAMKARRPAAAPKKMKAMKA